jgi:hypothetical protein
MAYSVVLMSEAEAGMKRLYCSEACAEGTEAYAKDNLKPILMNTPEYCHTCECRLPYEQAGHLFLPSASDWGMKEWNARFRHLQTVREVASGTQPEFRFYEITAVVAVQQYGEQRDGLDSVQMLDDSDFLISLKQTELRLRPAVERMGFTKGTGFTMEQTEEEA